MNRSSLVEGVRRAPRCSVQDLVDAHLADREIRGDRRVMRPTAFYLNDQRIYAPADKYPQPGDVVAYGDVWGLYVITPKGGPDVH